MDAGIQLGLVSSTGPPEMPATGAAESASAEARPLAMNTTGTPGSKLAAETSAETSYLSSPAHRSTGAYSASVFSTGVLIEPFPPRMTIRCGWSRASSAATAAGIPFDFDSSTGPPSMPATGAAESASATASPFATYATGTPGANVFADTAAETAYRSAPSHRSTTGANPAAGMAASTTPAGAAAAGPVTVPRVPTTRTAAAATHRLATVTIRSFCSPTSPSIRQVP